MLRSVEEAPASIQDVMVFVGLSATLTNGKTIASKGLQGYPKTATGQEVLQIVNNAMDHVHYIKSLPDAARATWAALIRERHAITHQLQTLDGGYKARSICLILKSPTVEQKTLAKQYAAIQQRINAFEMQPTMLEVSA